MNREEAGREVMLAAFDDELEKLGMNMAGGLRRLSLRRSAVKRKPQVFTGRGNHGDMTRNTTSYGEAMTRAGGDGNAANAILLKQKAALTGR